MSLGEGNELKNEDGGAHGPAHETLDDNCAVLSGQFIVAGRLSGSKTASADKTASQNGGQKEAEQDENGIGDTLPFLPELGTDCLDSYDNAVVENNTEWLKARCKTFGQIEFDIAPHSTGDDTLYFPGISLDSKVILPTDSTSTVLADRLAASANDTPKADGVTVISKSVTQGAQYATPYLTLSGSNIADTDHNWQSNSIPSVPMHSILQQNITSQKTISVNENNELNLGDIDLNFIKSNIGIKDGVVTLFSNESAIVDTITDNQPKKEPQSDSENGVTCDDTITIAQEQDESIPEIDQDDHDSENVAVVPAISGNLALTTISIATDEKSNSTKILVDTSQGRQLYHLNISDLTKLQNGTVLNVEGKTDDSAGAVNVPSYILLSNPSKEDAEMYSNGTPVMDGTVITPSSHEKTKTETLFMCNFEGCGKMFKNVAKLTVHTMTHTGQRPYKCTEPGCEWAFTKLYKLKRHVESHRGTKEYQCRECNKKFTTIYNLRTHTKHHSRPCTEECPVVECGLKFQTRRDLDKHLKTHEGIEKTYKCPYEGCNKLFLSPHCVGSHPRVHQMEPQNLTCQFDGCGRKFDKLCRLKQHQRIHTGEKPYVCHFNGCNWAFSTASKLTRHMTKHTNNRKWVCNECGKAFMRSEHLKGHMITHTGIKPFICPIQDCGQKFVSKSSVYVHLKKHERADKKSADKDISQQATTYHCPMESCDKKYNSKANLRAHIVKHFPGTLKPEDAAQLDIVPLINGVGAKETVVEPSAVSVKTAQDGSIVLVDPVEFISTSVDTKTGNARSSVHNQFTAELTAELSTLATPVETPAPPTSQTKAIFKKDGRDNERMSSARTDYESNQMLSDRAKKRRKLLREKAAGIRTEDTSNQASVESPGDLESSPVQESETMRSHGITFRDPETGVLYVQMQLLQDDPPHPDLYSDEHVLNSQLDMPTVIADPRTQDHEFVGSTINLQDLVG